MKFKIDLFLNKTVYFIPKYTHACTHVVNFFQNCIFDISNTVRPEYFLRAHWL